METSTRFAERLPRLKLSLVNQCLRALVAGYLCALIWFSAGGTLQAQDDERPSEPKPQVEVPYPDALKDGTLDLTARIYVPDKNNVPRLLPNIRVSDLIEWNIAQGRRGEGSNLPTFSFDQFLVEARVSGNVADVQSNITVTLGENAQRVTEIPLRLQSCLLTEPVRFQGPSKSQFQVGRNNQPGYTWWLQAEPGTVHTATLIGRSVIQGEGDRRSFQFTLPNTLATIILSLPEAFQDLSVRGQGGELISEQLQDGLRQITIKCQGGDLSVSWRTSSDSKTTAGAAEVDSKTRWDIDDPAATWEAESTISLRAHGDAIVERLVVDLPAGAQWIAEELPLEQYTISVEQVPLTIATPLSAPETASPENASPEKASPEKATPEKATPEKATPETVPALPAGAQANPAPQPDTAPVTRPRLIIRSLTRLGLSSLESIQFRWRWLPEASSPGNLAVPALTIRNVERHGGEITLVLPTSLGLEWKGSLGTELIQQSRIGSIPERVQYVFRFARQGQGLNVNFRREVNLADVKPKYLAEVDRDRIKLIGWLQCSFDRTQSPQLAFDMGPWQLDSAEQIADMASPYAEGELLDQRLLDEKNPRLFRFSSQRDTEMVTTGRRVQQLWRIVANINLAQAAGPQSTQSLSIELPGLMLFAPDQSLVPLQNAAGTLVVSASENVLLTWDQSASRLLLTDALTKPWDALQFGERLLTYRFQSGANETPMWVGRMDVLPRRIAAQQTVHLQIDAEMAQVNQRFELQIANEPLAELILDKQGAREVSVLVDGVPWIVEPDLGAPLAETTSTAQGSTAQGSTAQGSTAQGSTAQGSTAQGSTAQSSAGPAALAAVANNGPPLANRWRALSVKPLIGKVNVEVRSQLPLPAQPSSNAELAVGGPVERIVQLPLVQLLVENEVIRNPLRVTADVDRRSSVWLSKVDPLQLDSAAENPAAEAGTLASASNWLPLPAAPIVLPAGQRWLSLRLGRQSSSNTMPVRVEAAWLQTALSGTTRADRFCARFVTEQESLTIDVPSYNLAAEIAIDGVRQSFDPNDGRIQLSLRDFAASQEHTLEVWTRSANTVGWLNRIAVAPVQIDGCERFELFYWQLVTAPNQHLLILPKEMTAEWQWVWDRLWWRRFSSMDQTDLEQWLQASAQPTLAPGANKYVASSFGIIEPFEVWTASRLLLWLPIGLVAIGGSILVSLFRALRHPVALLLLIACILSMAAVWPDLAILVGQTSLLALLIVLLYALTQAAVESRVRRRSIFSTRPISSLQEISEAPSLVRPATTGSSEIVATTRTQSPIVSSGGGQ